MTLKQYFKYCSRAFIYLLFYQDLSEYVYCYKYDSHICDGPQASQQN